MRGQQREQSERRKTNDEEKQRTQCQRDGQQSQVQKTARQGLMICGVEQKDQILDAA
jgi:ribosomal protein S14